MATTDRIEDAVASLYNRYGKVVYSRCKRLLWNEPAADVEDVTQETFLMVYRAYRRGKQPETSELGWLISFATSASLHHIRTKLRKRPWVQLEPEQAQPSYGADQVREIHLRNSLAELMNKQDERGQAIFVYHFLDGMSQEEIADQLGISRRAVVKRLTRLRKQLSDRILEERQDGPM